MPVVGTQGIQEGLEVLRFAYERSNAINTTPTITEESKRLLLGA